MSYFKDPSWPGRILFKKGRAIAERGCEHGRYFAKKGFVPLLLRDGLPDVWHPDGLDDERYNVLRDWLGVKR